MAAELRQALIQAIDRRDFVTAQQKAQALLADEPADGEVWFLLGVAQRANGDAHAAAESYRRALAQYPQHADVWFNLGNALAEGSALEEAIAAYLKAVEYSSAHLAAWEQLARALAQAGRLDQAVLAITRRVELDPKSGDCQALRVKWLRQQARWNEAHLAFQQALHHIIEHAALLIEGAQVLEHLGDFRALAVLYQRLDSVMPNNPVVKFHLGLNRLRINQNTAALAVLRESEALGLTEPALWVNIGTALARVDQVEEAIDYLHRAAPTFEADPSAFVFAFALQQKLCDWRGFAQLPQTLLQPALAEPRPGAYPALPFPFTSFPGAMTEAEQLLIAQRFAAFIARTVQPYTSHVWKTPHTRVRIGYLSADFHNHATAHLMLGLFKRHDRRRFEVYAYSYGPEDGSEYRRRIREEVDHFVDLATLTDRDAAARIHSDEIDILIDLKGYTREARTHILAWRPSPVQVAWLGYPGSMGASFIDYALTDAVVTPPEQQVYYSEKLLYMPYTYQVNDDEQVIAAEVPGRAELGLPQQGFVFCCFCAHYKIEPRIFASWMNILKAVPGSVLWLIDGYEAARDNLRRTAAEHGVEPERLIFAARLDKAGHLARHAVADLFLDTHYYNAHTTMSDALWAGLPAITVPGITFASRVGASLLTACGLPELIAAGFPAYEQLAIELAHDGKRLSAVRQRLQAQRKVAPLFDTTAFVRDWEARLLEIVPLPQPLAQAVAQEGQLLENALNALQQNALPEARQAIETALNRGCDRPDAWNLYGVALRRLEQRETAACAYARGAGLKPDYADLLGNWGNLLREQHHIDEALALYRKAVQYAPDNLNALTNLGSALSANADPSGALAVWEAAERVAPASADVQWDKALVLLMLGRVRDGLSAYESRHARRNPPPREYPVPLWQGEPLAGRRILLHWEQGYGDTLQFLRFVPLVARLGGTVVMEVQPGLKRLVAEVEGVSEVVDAGEPLPAFDLFAPLLSVPRLLGVDETNLPASLPYLRAPAADRVRWRKRLGKSRRPKIGLVWAGNPNVKNDNLRSPRLAPLLRLLAYTQIDWVLLQQGDGRRDLQGLKLPANVIDLADEIDDFADTAALMQALDLVITSDTSTAHLAAALGCPTWVLLHFASDWRWGLGDESPWYPGVRLFRQRHYHDWAELAERLQQALGKQFSLKPLPPAAAPAQPEAESDLLLSAFTAYQRGHAWLARMLGRQALLKYPQRHDGWCLLGVVERARGDLPAAENAYRQALAISPEYGDAWFNLANLLRYQRKLEQAGEAYIAAARGGAGAKALSLLSDVQRELQQLDLAEASARRALELQPDFAEAWGHLGNALNDQERFAEAADCYDHALHLPGCPPETLYNKGVALQRSRRVEDSIRCYRDILISRPAEAHAHYNLATALLTLEHFREGFAEYEWRLKKGDLAPRQYAVPAWQGEPLNGRRLLLYWEQGYGDSLQFLRFVPLVVAAGGRVVLEMQAGLKTLLAGMPGVEAVVDAGETLPSFDLHASLLSVAALLGLGDNGLPGTPYLSVPPAYRQRWQGKVADSGKLRVGLVWAGNPNVKNDRVRSPRLAPLLPLLQLEGIEWYILQQGDGRRDLETVKPLPAMVDIANGVSEFADTAAIMEQLDLVISSDTSTAHLAAALGCPTWVLLHYAADWRWGEGRQTPWYPQARLFRQQQPGDWLTPIRQVEQALVALLAEATV